MPQDFADFRDPSVRFKNAKWVPRKKIQAYLVRVLGTCP
jgi:hypothetical protein